MQRQAILTSGTLGTIDTYRGIIRDISEVLGDPMIDMQSMFYAVMIQSGIERFCMPRSHVDLAPTGVVDRVTSVDLQNETATLDAIRTSIISSMDLKSCTEEQIQSAETLAGFLQELHVAAVFRRPVVTTLDVPSLASLSGVLREDLLVVVGAIVGAVISIEVHAPLTKLSIPARELTSYRRILDSGLFAPYAESQSLLESPHESSANALTAIGQRSRALVNAFPDHLDLRRTGVSILQSVPDVLDAIGGKVFGAATKPFITAIADALTAERRLVVYSFHPVWRKVWNSKLDKVRARRHEWQ